MNSKFGSEWHKWDFHIHTPYSILNNQYGFNPFEIDDVAEREKAFDEYVTKLFTKAIENDIAAIGITDYFMVEGYKYIKEKYLEKPEKLKELFPDDELREKVEQIYIFPNIEFRLETFVGEKSHSVNYHVIFSDSVSVRDIEENFLHQLKFKVSATLQLSLTKANIESFGQRLKEDNGAKGSDLLVGLKHIVVYDSDILNILSNNPAFAGKYLITIPVDENLSEIKWDGRDYPIRKNLYQQCHCYLTSNEKTATWALAEGEEEERKKEFGSLKPCIWGSDAHEYERMFHPANDKFCWIKAVPSFEGLMQILYEPKDRVVVQKDYPDEKDPHQIIQSIQFEDENFQEEPILFNDYLTCIIGGKSTGKSLLLQQVAKTIDNSYVEAQEKISVPKRKQFSVNKTVVTWKDGTTDSRKIVYIPQTFLNRTIDNPEKSTAINQIIKGVLLQETEISNAYKILEDTLKTITDRTKEDISNFCEKEKNLLKLEEELKRDGNSETFKKTIAELIVKRTDLAGKIDIKQEEIDQYVALEIYIKSLEEDHKKYLEELQNIEKLTDPIAVVPQYFNSTSDGRIVHHFEHNFPYTGERLQKALEELNSAIQLKWEERKRILSEDINERLEGLNTRLEEKKKEYESLKVKVEQNEVVQKLSVQISTERQKLLEAERREKSCQDLKNKMIELKSRIIGSQKDFFNAYNEYCSNVVSIGTNKNTELTFDANAVWKQESFQNSISSIFDNRNFMSFRSAKEYDLLCLAPDVYGEDLLNAIWTAMNEPQQWGGLTIKSAYTKENAMQQLFGDWYNIHYVVKSGDDTIEDMSPGKKALVLLELLISLEDSKCPILIDQPEDDLDNRSIYEDLVQFIKKKKKERQIIVVTHNANIVLGADAEEVIIANQNGKGTENASRRFEYRSGAIENDEIELDQNGNPIPGILNAYGIQTQICDILEGGHPAFELRKNKYMKATQH